MVAASRKSIDDHIVLVGWLPENGRDEAFSLELGNDLWLPRIELQGEFHESWYLSSSTHIPVLEENNVVR